MRLLFGSLGVVIALAATAVARPVLTFVRAKVADSASVVQQRAFDVLLREAVEATGCCSYVDVALRERVTASYRERQHPLTFQDLADSCGVTHGVFFTLDRFGYALRLASRIVGTSGPVFERVDVDLLQASDTIHGGNAYEWALRRLLHRFVAAAAPRLDSACAIAPDSVLPVTIGAVLISKGKRGFAEYLADNAARIANLGVARMADSLRGDARFVVVDIHSRDELYARLHEYDIQNTVAPGDPEIAIMHGAGIAAYLVAEIDTGKNGNDISVRVGAYLAQAGAKEPVAVAQERVRPELERIYTAMNRLACKAAEGVRDVVFKGGSK